MRNLVPITPVTNPDYEFTPAGPTVEGYLILGEKEGKAVIKSFGNSHMTPSQAIDWYTREKVKVVKVYTGGCVISLGELRQELHQRGIDEVIERLDRELLNKS